MTALGRARTDEEAAVEALIAQVPQWATSASAYAQLCPDVVSPMHRGVAGALWLVEPEGGAAGVLKVPRPDMDGLFDRAAGATGAQLAGETGAGPGIIWADADGGAVAMEHLGKGWRTASLADLQEARVMKAALDAARAFQAGAALPVRFDVFAEIRALEARLIAANIALPADGWWMLEQATAIEKAIAAAGHDLVPCRNDGVSSNIMIGPEGAVKLLDYDRAGMNDPAYDLAVLLTEVCAFVSEREPYVEHWAGRADTALLNRTVVYGAADDLMWALWAMLSAETSPRVHVEFRKYAEWRLLRCRQAMLQPQFEERLRKL